MTSNRDRLLAGAAALLERRVASLLREEDRAMERGEEIKLKGIPAANRWNEAVDKIVERVDTTSDIDQMPAQVLESVGQRIVEDVWRWMRVGDAPVEGEAV